MAIIIVTAPSGAGKTSIMGAVASLKHLGLGECISMTTREIRDGEEDGVTYYYTDKGTFETLKDNGEFAEHVEYSGNYYGIQKEEIERVLEEYNHVYIIAEYNGYKQLKTIYPNAVGIFMHMSKEDCMANMLLRGDSYDNATKRIGTYEEEIKNKGEFDYVIKNVRGKQRQTENLIYNIITQYDN